MSPSAPDRAAAAPAAVAEPRATARVLVAEDDPEMRALLVAVLRRDGCEVSVVHDGVQLAERLRALGQGDALGTVDLVISDIRMPGMSGLQALAHLARSGARPAVILITAFGDSETHADAHSLGAQAVFNKPFDLDDLRTVVACLCGTR